MQIDPQKTAMENVFDLINSANSATGLNLASDTVTIGVPTTRTPTEDNTHNTVVSISPKPNTAIGGEDVDVTYDRVLITSNAVNTDLDRQILTTPDFDTEPDRLAVEWGAIRDQFTYTIKYPEMPHDRFILTLTPIANSLVYLPTDVVVTYELVMG